MKDPRDVNIAQNLISEAPTSNLSPKAMFDRRASKLADENPNSIVTVVAEPIRKVGETRPFGVTYTLTRDGKVVEWFSIPNR